MTKQNPGFGDTPVSIDTSKGEAAVPEIRDTAKFVSDTHVDPAAPSTEVTVDGRAWSIRVAAFVLPNSRGPTRDELVHLTQLVIARIGRVA